MAYQVEMVEMELDFMKLEEILYVLEILIKI